MPSGGFAMKKRIVVLLAVLLIAVIGWAQPSGFFHWSGAQLKDAQKTLPSKMNAQKSATFPMASFDTHLIQLSYREASGEAEVHAQMTDVFVVQDGEATLTTGGKLVNGKSTAAGEIRGTAIADGQQKVLGAGDVVHIPAGMPHQLTLKPGQKFTYLVIKVKTAS
jgi:mannose-6-phosphate isomerase-like protein (cupin superfamily)